MKKNFILVLMSVFLLASCGSKNSIPLAELNAKDLVIKDQAQKIKKLQIEKSEDRKLINSYASKLRNQEADLSNARNEIEASLANYGDCKDEFNLLTQVASDQSLTLLTITKYIGLMNSDWAKAEEALSSISPINRLKRLTATHEINKQHLEYLSVLLDITFEKREKVFKVQGFNKEK